MTSLFTPLALSMSLAAAAGLVTPQPPRPALPPSLHAAKSEQSEIARKLSSYVSFCGTYAKPEYRADCLAERFSIAADGLGQYGETADVYRALKRASRDLARISRRYATPETPPVVLASPEITTTRPIQPVAKANLAAATAAAEGVLQDGELTLLRSSTLSPDTLALAEVAQVLQTAKVLLRSS